MTENDLVNSARHIKQTVGVGSDRSAIHARISKHFPSSHIGFGASFGEWGIFWLHSARMLFLLRFLVSEGLVYLVLTTLKFPFRRSAK